MVVAVFKGPKTVGLTVFEDRAVGVDLGGGSSIRVDRENGIIRGVKIVGLQSVNTGRAIGATEEEFGDAVNHPYSYDRDGLKKAVALYEGKQVFSNHLPFTVDPRSGARIIQAVERDNGKLTGWFSNVRFKDDVDEKVAGLYGDWHVLKSNPLANMFFEVAERNPEAFAMSHEAFTFEPVVRNGRLILPGIARVDAIAVVSATPGTTFGLFELGTPKAPTMKTFREMFSAVPNTHKGGRRVMEMMEGDAGAPIAALPVADESVDADTLTKQAFRAMLMAAIDDDSLDTAATVARVKEVLNAQDKLLGKVADDVIPPPDDKKADGEGDKFPPKKDGEKKVDEAKIAADAQGLVFECVGLLNEANVPNSRAIVEAMALIPTPEGRKKYAIELGRVTAPPPPGQRSAAPQPPAGEKKPADELKPIESFDDFAKALRNPPL